MNIIEYKTGYHITYNLYWIYISFLYRVIMIRCDDFKNKYDWIVSGGPNINGHRFVKPTSAIQVHVETLYKECLVCSTYFWN